MQKYLHLSTLSYGNDILPFLETAGSAYFFSGTRADVQFYTLHYDTELVFAIRGSESSSDFMDDLFCWTEAFQDTDVPGCRVHSGFLKQYRAMRFAVMSAVYKMMWKCQGDGLKPKSVVFTGHSLGGALATLCATAVKSECPQLHVSAYTFGSPRVGNKAFAKAFEAVDLSVRCVNGSDLVSYGPNWGYEHVKGLKLIGQNIGQKKRPNVADHKLEAYALNCVEI